jgi:hypothetical protein
MYTLKKGNLPLFSIIKRKFPSYVQLLFMFRVFLFKLFYPSLGIQQFLLAGKERVTLGTDINVYGVLGGSRGERFAAGAHRLDLF